MMRSMRGLLALGLLLVVGCTSAAAPGDSGGAGASGEPGASGSPFGSGAPSASASGSLSEAALKYRLVDQLGRPLFCDPDEYPVARADVAQLAVERLPQIQADQPTFAAITSHLGDDPAGLTSKQALDVYTEWKMLRVLTLTPAGSGRWSFDYVAQGSGIAQPSGAPPGSGGVQVSGDLQGVDHVTGSITADGQIQVASTVPSRPPPCPICLARGTRIATPSGPVAVEDVRIGQLVWSVTAVGRRLAEPVVEIGSVPVPANHEVVDLVLSDGREVHASPRHPLPDGRTLGDLRPGDRLDGARVVGASLEPYSGGRTFDLLPAGPTGAYWADGILLASTLAD